MKKEEKLEHTIKIVTFFLVNKNRNIICFFCYFPSAAPNKTARNQNTNSSLHKIPHRKIKFTLQNDYFK